MYSPRSREDSSDLYYNRRAPVPHVLDDSQQLYAQRNYGYSSPEILSDQFAHRRFASTSPTTRYPDHADYPVPHGMPSLSAGRMPEMSRIDTARRSSLVSNAQPVSATSLDLSPDSEPWSPTAQQPHRPPRKTRREKPRIELAPDQPPTTQGKPRARVYVACVQCRTRKIRCDGAKPICHNCGKRPNGSAGCNYDALPKRRGPDKTPGARQRVARKMSGEASTRPRRRATSSAPEYPADPDNTGTQLPPFSFPSPTSSSENTHSPDMEYTTSPHEVRMNAPGSYISTCACHGLSHCPSSPLEAGPHPILDHGAPGTQFPMTPL